jgi:acyl-coenzyme A synthetase/AMP-(fatty) acid ligase
MVLNPIAVFKLEPGTIVEVLADGETYTAEFVSAKEYVYSEGDAALDRLDADSGYIVNIGDSDVAIPEDAVIEILRFAES